MGLKKGEVKVLVVDNDRDVCWVISDILKEEGYSVNIACDGKTAMEKIQKKEYGVMILDYKLFGISGLTILEAVRKIKPSMQIIMISAFGNEYVRARAEELGAYGFLDKPFDIKGLMEVVNNAWLRKGRDEVDRSSSLKKAESKSNKKGGDKDGRRKSDWFQ